MIGLVIKSFIPFGGFSDGPIIPVIGRLSLDLIHERIFVMFVNKHVKVFVGIGDGVLEPLKRGTGAVADFLKHRLRNGTSSRLDSSKFELRVIPSTNIFFCPKICIGNFENSRVQVAIFHFNLTRAMDQIPHIKGSGKSFM